MYTLHGFSLSGNTFKVATMLNVLAAPWQAQYVDYLQGQTRNDDWRANTNAMGEVPVLEVYGKRRTQSGAILTWLAEQHGQYGGMTGEEREEVLRWLLFDNHKFTSYLASYRFAKSFGPTEPDPAVMAWLRGRIDSAFGIVNRHLAEREYLVGIAPTIADFSLCGYLCYPEEETGLGLVERHPHIAAWLERLRQMPGWVGPYECLPGERVAPRW